MGVRDVIYSDLSYFVNMRNLLCMTKHIKATKIITLHNRRPRTEIGNQFKMILSPKETKRNQEFSMHARKDILIIIIINNNFIVYFRREEGSNLTVSMNSDVNRQNACLELNNRIYNNRHG